ncbi:MAG: hypothetical protein ACRCXT_11885 [Paraclostridium sp.]
MLKKLLVTALAIGVSSTAIIKPSFANDSLDESYEISPRINQSKPLDIPGGKGRLISDTWRTNSDGVVSGNTRQWDYQVAAKYSGSKAVEWIETRWTASASLRNQASMNLGVGDKEASAGSSSSWQAVQVEHYAKNTLGQKEASVRRNLVIGPKSDYRPGTVYVKNQASIKLKDDAKIYRITSGV